MEKIWKKIIFILLINLNLNASEIIDKTLLLNACKGCELVEVSLNGLINEVIKRNYELYLEKSKVQIAQHKISMEEGIFEPMLQASATYRRTNVPNSAEQTMSRGFQDNYRDRVRGFGTSVGGLLSTGGEWKLGFTDSKISSNLINETQDYDTEYSNGFSLSFKQPLLRGMGKDVTYAKINMAKLGGKINETEYKNNLMGLIATTIRLYWRLYGTQKLYESWSKTLNITEQQLNTIQLLAQYGKIPETEILEVKSSIFEKRTELINLKLTIDEIKNQLLSLLNVSNKAFSSTLFVVKDKPNITENKLNLDVEDNYKKAIENLPELRLAELKIASGKLEYKYNENQLLPDLTLNTSVSTLGLSNLRNNAMYCSTSCNEQVSWNVGLNLEIPLYGNDKASANLAISRIRLKNSELAINSFQKGIYNAIVTKIEQLKIEKIKLDQYKKEVEMKAELLSIERQKMELGKSRIRNILEYEEKLKITERKFLGSIVKWKVTEALLLKTTGDLLKHQDIELDFKLKNPDENEELNSKFLEY